VVTGLVFCVSGASNTSTLEDQYDPVFTPNIVTVTFDHASDNVDAGVNLNNAWSSDNALQVNARFTPPTCNGASTKQGGVEEVLLR
jgi:hypothetical protein